MVVLAGAPLCGTAESAINLLLDAVITIQAAGSDDGVRTGRTLSGSALTLDCDRVQPDIGRDLVDHSGGQTAHEFMRTRKLRQSLEIELKLEKSTSSALSKMSGASGVVVAFTITAVGFNCSGYGIVENLRPTLDTPSTFRFTIRSYGTAWALAA